MTIPELEQQLLSLSQSERLRLSQLLTQSLAGSANAIPEALDLTQDRSPHHPLRNLPLPLPADFDEPMAEPTAIQKIQDLLQQVLEPGYSLADELIAERREAAKHE